MLSFPTELSELVSANERVFVYYLSHSYILAYLGPQKSIDIKSEYVINAPKIPGFVAKMVVLQHIWWV